MSTLSTNQIASIIDSDIRTGLKGTSNYSFSLRMLEREVIVERNSELKEEYMQPGFRQEGYVQSINCIPTSKKGLSRCPGGLPGLEEAGVIYASIPALEAHLLDSSVMYVGPPVRTGFGWKVYFNEAFRTHKFNPAVCHLPYVYIDPSMNSENGMDAFVFNYSGNLTTLSLTGILTNPEDAEEYSCHGPLLHFPAPEPVVKRIIKKVADKYIYHYRKLHAPTQANTQSDQVS
jgi:hypothetical protein